MKKEKKKGLSSMMSFAPGVVGPTATLGVGASVVGSIGGPAGAAGASMMANMASGLPAAGSAIGGGIVVNAMGSLLPEKKRRSQI
jgi:hypothetical protein